MSRKIIVSGLSILTAAAMVSAATWAYFNDTNASAGNTFSTGNVDLRLSDGDEGVTQNVTASFGSAALLGPGDCLAPQTLNIRNSGSLPGNHVDITVTNDNGTMTPYLRVNSLSYGVTDLLPVLTSTNSTVIKDLDDLATGSVLTNLTLSDLATDHPLTMSVCLDESAPNAVQGTSNIMDLSIFLDQGSHT